MTELDDDDITCRDNLFNLGKAPFVGIGPGGAARDGFVDDGDCEVLGEVGAPTCSGLLVAENWRRAGMGEGRLTIETVAGLGHGAVASKVHRRRRALHSRTAMCSRHERDGQQCLYLHDV